MKKKAIIIISIIVVILIIIGLVYFLVINKDSENNSGNTGNDETVQEAGTSKTNKLYEKLSESDKYTFEKVLNDENKSKTVKSGELAYKEETANGNTYKYIVKDGNTYLLQDDAKQYYKYENNTIILSEITNNLLNLQKLQCQTGKEEIEGKSYEYEEYHNYGEFLVNTDLQIAGAQMKTRFYYSGNNLKYIKTIVNDTEELLKIDISYKADEALFEIPSDYSDAENS